MLDSVIAVIADFVLPYAVLSFFTVLLVEMFAAMRQLRAKTLRHVVEHMLGPAQAARLYDHPLIRPLAFDGRLPSYIPSSLFACVCHDLARRRSGGPAGVDADLRARMAPLLDRDDDAARPTIDALARWFDQVVACASGSYRLKVQWLVLAVAGIVVLATDLDALQISDAVSSAHFKESVLKSCEGALSAGGAPTPAFAFCAKELAPAAPLPIGWSVRELSALLSGSVGPDVLMRKALGLVISILAVSTLAPFFFDLLGRLHFVRIAGRSPAGTEEAGSVGGSCRPHS